VYFFTADEHYGHFNAIRHSNRPFDTVEEMGDKIIANHNEVVKDNDFVIHLGDFTLKDKFSAMSYINRLNGSNIFLRGSHDKWMDKTYHEIWEKTINGQKIVACHYAMRVWAASHYNSWHIYGHSHGRLKSEGKSYDVGVDNNNFYPVSFDQLKEIMAGKPDNINLLKRN